MGGVVLQRWLLRSWWLVFPSFALLTARLSFERACGEPYDLLPALTSSPAWAWPIAAAYVVAHAWLLSAYLLTASSADTLVPPRSAWRAVWHAHTWKLLLMLVAFGIEYAPVPMWRWLGAATACGR